MTPSDPDLRERRADSARAFSIMFFFAALLCAALGWAEGVRHGTKVLRIPETGGWLVAAGVLAVLGALFLIWARSTRAAASDSLAGRRQL
jgi:hypothetical protein